MSRTSECSSLSLPVVRERVPGPGCLWVLRRARGDGYLQTAPWAARFWSSWHCWSRTCWGAGVGVWDRPAHRCGEGAGDASERYYCRCLCYVHTEAHQSVAGVCETVTSRFLQALARDSEVVWGQVSALTVKGPGVCVAFRHSRPPRASLRSNKYGARGDAIWTHHPARAWVSFCSLCSREGDSWGTSINREQQKYN